MKASLAVPPPKCSRILFLAALLVVAAAAAPPAHGQQPSPNPILAACGHTSAVYTVTHVPPSPVQADVPAGKALVYVIETMPDIPMVSKKVNIGLDGAWLGATDAQTHISFAVDPGIHHLCAVYQGRVNSMDADGQTLLLHLNAEAGKIYYLRYHALLTESGGLAFFDSVDEDEGPFLLQRTAHVTSALKK